MVINALSYVSNRVGTLKPSGIRKFFDIAATMKDVISLGIGEPDFTTPPPILEAGHSLAAARRDPLHLERRPAGAAQDPLGAPRPALRSQLRPGQRNHHHRGRLRGALPGGHRAAQPRRRDASSPPRASSPTRPKLLLAGGVPVEIPCHYGKQFRGRSARRLQPPSPRARGPSCWASPTTPPGRWPAARLCWRLPESPRSTT